MGSHVATEDSRVAHRIHVPKILDLIPITTQQEKENGIDNEVHSFPAPCNQKQQTVITLFSLQSEFLWPGKRSMHLSCEIFV